MDEKTLKALIEQVLSELGTAVEPASAAEAPPAVAEAAPAQPTEEASPQDPKVKLCSPAIEEGELPDITEIDIRTQ